MMATDIASIKKVIEAFSELITIKEKEVSNVESFLDELNSEMAMLHKMVRKEWRNLHKQLEKIEATLPKTAG